MRVLVFLLLVSVRVLGQSDSIPGPFVKLKSGKLLLGTDVQFSEKILNKRVIIDGKEIPATTVSLFKTTQNELYGNTSTIGAVFNKSFYSAKDADFFVSGSAGTANMGSLLFSHKLSPLKIASAKSLRNLMKSDSVANSLIYRANVSRTVSNISLLTATGLFGFSIAQMFSSNRLAQSTERGIEVLGSGCIILAIVTNGAKKRNTREAIKKYYGIEIE